MLRTLFLFCVLITALFTALCSFLLSAEPERIVLRAEMVIDASGLDIAKSLVDEQSFAPTHGDVIASGAPKTAWDLGWVQWQTYYPAEAIVDLKQVCHLTRIAWFDGAGDAPLEWSCWQEDHWEDFHHDTLKQFNTWTTREVDVTSRYLRLVQRKPGGVVTEIAVYGEPNAANKSLSVEQMASKEKALKAKPRAPVTMDQFIGVNSFIDTPIDVIAPVAGNLREYHQWMWDEGNQGRDYQGRLPAWSPSYVSGPGWGWDFDAFYERAHKAGIEVQPVLQGTAPYAVDFRANSGQHKPLHEGASPETPASYADHAAYLFQFAARYGSTEVPLHELQLNSNQTPRSGLGWVHWVENWNEPDKWWEGREARFRPFELAAMCSADYDGNQRRMGKGYGLKNADPEMKMLVGGLAGIHIEYFRAMKLWSDLYRNGVFPADGIAIHHYCHEGAAQEGKGISPEADGLTKRLSKAVQWRDQNEPHLQIWFGEFGYDTQARSPQRVEAWQEFSAEQMQGFWLVRSCLAAADAGVDRAQVYMIRDVNPTSTTQYDTSGLTGTLKDQHPRKPAYFHMATLRSALRGMMLDRDDRATTEPGVYRRRYVSPDLPRRVEVIWACEEQHKSAPVTIDVKPNEQVELISLSDEQLEGFRQRLTPDAIAQGITPMVAPQFILIESEPEQAVR